MGDRIKSLLFILNVNEFQMVSEFNIQNKAKQIIDKNIVRGVCDIKVERGLLTESLTVVQSPGRSVTGQLRSTA